MWCCSHTKLPSLLFTPEKTPTWKSVTATWYSSFFAPLGLEEVELLQGNLVSDRLPPRPFTLETKIGKRYTLVLGGEGFPRIIPFEENLNGAAPDGQVSLRVYNVSRSSGNISLQAGSGETQLKSYALGETGQVWVPRNTTNLSLRFAGSSVELIGTKSKLERDTSVFVLERDLDGAGVFAQNLTVLND